MRINHEVTAALCTSEGTCDRGTQKHNTLKPAIKIFVYFRPYLENIITAGILWEAECEVTNINVPSNLFYILKVEVLLAHERKLGYLRIIMSNLECCSGQMFCTSFVKHI